VQNEEVQIDAAVVRRAMHDRGLSPDETWRLTIRGGPNGSAIHRALNGGKLERSAAEKLAAILHVNVEALKKPPPDASGLVHVDRDRILGLMKARKWKPRTLAIISEVPPKAVRAAIFKIGDGTVTASVATRLADAFGVPVEDLTRRP
jgi:hypothetical protein